MREARNPQGGTLPFGRAPVGRSNGRQTSMMIESFLLRVKNMIVRFCSFGLMAVLMFVGSYAMAAGQPLAVEAGRFRAEFQNGCLTSLVGQNGAVMVVPQDPPQGITIHRVAGDYRSTIASGVSQLVNSAHPTVTRHYAQFAELKDARAEATFRLDRASGDLVVTPSVQSKSAGVWGVGWSIGDIPLDYSIIVPGRSGVRLSRSSPGRREQFDYPIGWEAQLVIIEGPTGGFYVWAEDVQGRYKRLVVQRDSHGWQLQFTTINDAPFDKETSCQSVPWHVQVYQGDWRVPARRYRDWADAHFRPTLIQEQRPAWVKDTRAVVIMGLDEKTLDALPTRLDPKQTLLYIPSWRAAGYDRDYPTYDQPVEQLQPFLERAHALGFRVMLHVNYFGVDPLNQAYAKFASYQCRDPWGEHKKLWWLWTRADPDIQFAYINPALKQWRDLFTRAMVRLCHDYKVDALHLDQTLVIYNDHNGRIDGMSMIEGNIALHRQLREALPEVAISGEGLNEITYRYEAFAQRHAWGVNHADGTWDRHRIGMAHPISSYLFRPYVVIYGYLGCAPPTNPQLYAAWQAAYSHWGVVPTLKPSLPELLRPTGFSRQFFDEVRFWQQQRVAIDMESNWPAEVAFPMRTADGRHAEYTVDGRLQCQETVIRRTVSGTNRIAGSGTIPNWHAFDDHAIVGLDRNRWYPYFEQPRNDGAFHISSMPDGMIADTVVARQDIVIVRVVSPMTVVADLVQMLDDATVGSRPFHGKEVESKGPFIAPDGAQFQRVSDQMLAAHPPWKATHIDPKTGVHKQDGTGLAFARYSVRLPRDGQIRLRGDVMLSHDAIGKPRADGVTFGCTVRAGDQVAHNSLHQATDKPEPLNLDLTAFAGQVVTVELTVDPGPARVPQFDWARWIQPRIERTLTDMGSLAVIGGPKWNFAIGQQGPTPLHTGELGQTVQTSLPGTVFFLPKAPEPIRLPCDLVHQQRHAIATEFGEPVVVRSPFLNVHATASTVGGVTRVGLFAHPPDHGQTMILLPMTLPDRAATFATWIGIRDGSKSTGVIFRVEVNGQVVGTQRMVPGKWQRLTADLSNWRGMPIVLSLITDSDGPYDCDWAHWGTPEIVE